MDRHGTPEDWAFFYATLGRYATSAGNAESLMYRLLLAMRSRTGRPAPAKPPMWSGLVKLLIEEAKDGPHQERAETLLRGAARRGRLRNDIIHAGWFSASPEGYASRRHPANGDPSAMLFIQRETLEQDLVTMEWFENELQRLAQDVTFER
jgi:hypothetical protein